MQPDCPYFEPGSAALLQHCRLFGFREAEHTPIEASRLGFTAGRHRNLHMIDGADGDSAAAGRVGAAPPTLPSSLMAISFCASTANSIGSCCSTSRTKPLTINAVASSAERPRCRQ